MTLRSSCGALALVARRESSESLSRLRSRRSEISTRTVPTSSLARSELRESSTPSMRASSRPAARASVFASCGVASAERR